MSIEWRQHWVDLFHLETAKFQLQKYRNRHWNLFAWKHIQREFLQLYLEIKKRKKCFLFPYFFINVFNTNNQSCVNDHLSTTITINPAQANLVLDLHRNNDHLSTMTSDHLKLVQNEFLKNLSTRTTFVQFLKFSF